MMVDLKIGVHIELQGDLFFLIDQTSLPLTTKGPCFSLSLSWGLDVSQTKIGSSCLIWDGIGSPHVASKG